MERLRAELFAAQARADNLEIGLRTSRRIGAAIGILMSRYCLSIDDAFDLLRLTSQHSNRKLRDIAEEVLDTGTADASSANRSRHRAGSGSRAHLRLVNQLPI